LIFTTALTLIALATGERRQLLFSQVDERCFARVRDALGANGAMGAWRLQFVPMMLDGSHAFELLYDERRVSVGFVGATATIAEMMWANALDYAMAAIAPPESLPWLATAAEPGMGTMLREHPAIDGERQEIERCLGWAIL
jgi:hypothetical protein